MTDIGTLGGSDSLGSGINGNGQVTGWADTANGEQRAFLYSGGLMTGLGTLGGTSSVGKGVSNNGQVTGYSYIAGDSAYHAFLYNGGVMTDIGTLGGSYSFGFAINNSGQVTGYAATPGDSASHAFLYSGGVMTDLGGTNSMGEGINNLGQVVGDTSTGAFLYSGGTMYDLNSLVVGGLSAGDSLVSARGISDTGWIVAEGLHDRAYALEPVSTATPEPASWALLLAGGLLLAIYSYRRAAAV